MDWNERQKTSDTFAKERESNKNYGSRTGGQKDVEENGATDNIVRLADCSAAKKNHFLVWLEAETCYDVITWIAVGDRTMKKMPTVASTDVASTSFHFISFWFFVSVRQTLTALNVFRSFLFLLFSTFKF
jgi:hypothetical protein